MPTYEYKCRDCDDMFEIQTSMNSPLLTVCKKCNGKLQKLFSAPVISFKGSGFCASVRGILYIVLVGIL